MNRGDSEGWGSYRNKLLSTSTVQVCTPGALAMVMPTPFLKGSVFNEGMVRTTWEGDSSEGQNWMQPLVMLTLMLKDFEPCAVNSPHLRKPAKVW